MQVLELLEIIQFRSTDTTMKHSKFLSHTKFGTVVQSNFYFLHPKHIFIIKKIMII